MSFSRFANRGQQITEGKAADNLFQTSKWSNSMQHLVGLHSDIIEGKGYISFHSIFQMNNVMVEYCFCFDHFVEVVFIQRKKGITQVKETFQ